MTAATIEQARPTARLLARAIGLASIGSALATSVIAFVAHAAGVSEDFDPIAPAAYLSLAVIGVSLASALPAMCRSSLVSDHSGKDIRVWEVRVEDDGTSSRNTRPICSDASLVASQQRSGT